MTSRHLQLALLSLAALWLPGCTAGQATFKGYGEQQVWLAMKAAAHLPGYDDLAPKMRWQVDANNVWADEDGKRIEIHRELSRWEGNRIDRRVKRTRVFDIEIRMASADPPEATFTKLVPGRTFTLKYSFTF